jgi:hypothetical protein
MPFLKFCVGFLRISEQENFKNLRISVFRIQAKNLRISGPQKKSDAHLCLYLKSVLWIRINFFGFGSKFVFGFGLEFGFGFGSLY